MVEELATFKTEEEHDMIRWILRLLYRIVWGNPVNVRVPVPQMHGQGVKPVERGRTVLKPYINMDVVTGERYVKVSFRWKVGRDNGLEKSARIKDFKDIRDAMAIIEVWAYDNDLV